MGTYEYLVESTASPTLPERMQELYAAGELMDTTLVCKNGSVRAHKVVMAAQSKFLEDVLVQHPCKSPVIVLLDLDIDTLRCLVDYMYHGKVAIKASIFDDFVKAANVLRLVSIIRGPEGHDEEADVGEHNDSTQLVACDRNDANSFEGTVCHMEEMNNFVDSADTSTNTTTTTVTTTATESTTTPTTTRLETSEVIPDGQELVQVQSLEGHVGEDSFVTDNLTVAIAPPTSRPVVTSSNIVNQQHASGLRTIVISSRANFDQRPTQRLFTQRPVERIRLCRTNQSKRRRFDVVALRSRPPPATVVTSGASDVVSSRVGKVIAIPGTGPPPPQAPLTAEANSLTGGATTKLVQGGTPAVAATASAGGYNSRKCESLARIEAGMIRAEQREGGESNLDELVNVHQQMVVDSNGVRMHQCLLCPQTTAFPSNMKRHIMGHLGIKPYKCNHCDFQSTLRGDLNVHMRKKHPNEESQQNMMISMK